MAFFSAGLLVWMLLCPSTAMDAASAACALFVHSVLPALFPYMTAVRMLRGRVRPQSIGAYLLLGWAGGSPNGALLSQTAPRQNRRLAVQCATMSPIFLAGTLGVWLQSSSAAALVLFSVLLGGFLTGLLVREKAEDASLPSSSALPVSLVEAIESSARAMLMVCGTLVMMRVLAALLCEALANFPGLCLAITTVLEVTSGASLLARMPWPMGFRVVLLAAATGFGGVAILLQNRAAMPRQLLSLPAQIGYQALHALLSGLIALGMWTLGC